MSTHKPWMRPIEDIHAENIKPGGIIRSRPNASLNFGTKQTTLPKWDSRFLSLAEHISAWSKDPSTKCGAVITHGNKIASLGFNGFPQGVKDSDELYDTRDLKLQMILHAEVNALMFATEDLTNATIYTWPFPPCCRCAAQIIQAGINRVVAPAPSGALGERWAEELEVAKMMYFDAEVDLVEVKE